MSELANNNDRLSAFLAGELSESENEKIIEQLLEDEKALRVVDRLWQNRFAGAASTPILSDDATKDGESKLFRRLRRSQLTNQFVNFGANGLVNVVLAFIKPIFDRPRAGSNNKRENNGKFGAGVE